MIVRSLLIALLAAAAGCGEDAKAPEAKLSDPAGYFGLKVCTCYRYKTDGSEDTLGIGIERTVKRGDVQPFELRYRNGNGVQFRTELLLPTSKALQLWEVTSQGGMPSWSIDAGVPLVSWPLDNRSQAPVITDSPVVYHGESPISSTTTLRADYGPPAPVTFQRGDSPETADGVRISYLVSSGEPTAPVFAIGPHTFVPNVGFVTIEQFDTGVPSGPRTWNLVSVTPIADCPFPDENHGPTCGI